MDQIAFAIQNSVRRIRNTPSNLTHPQTIAMDALPAISISAWTLQ